jgi:DNA-binding response OmpR family regulator
MKKAIKKLLIAEDEEVLLNVLKDRFQSEGWEVITAVNGEEALTLLKKVNFDLLLLDLLMPQKDGFAVLEEINGLPKLQKLPIIVLSNLGADDDIKRALDLGARDYFVKTKNPLSKIVSKANKYVK